MRLIWEEYYVALYQNKNYYNFYVCYMIIKPKLAEVYIDHCLTKTDVGINKKYYAESCSI
jgi:hypothetical protein